MRNTNAKVKHYWKSSFRFGRLCLRSVCVCCVCCAVRWKHGAFHAAFILHVHLKIFSDSLPYALLLSCIIPYIPTSQNKTNKQTTEKKRPVWIKIILSAMRSTAVVAATISIRDDSATTPNIHHQRELFVQAWISICLLLTRDSAGFFHLVTESLQNIYLSTTTTSKCLTHFFFFFCLNMIRLQCVVT